MSDSSKTVRTVSDLTIEHLGREIFIETSGLRISGILASLTFQSKDDNNFAVLTFLSNPAPHIYDSTTPCLLVPTDEEIVEGYRRMATDRHETDRPSAEDLRAAFRQVKDTGVNLGRTLGRAAKAAVEETGAASTDAPAKKPSVSSDLRTAVTGVFASHAKENATSAATATKSAFKRGLNTVAKKVETATRDKDS